MSNGDGRAALPALAQREPHEARSTLPQSVNVSLNRGLTLVSSPNGPMSLEDRRSSYTQRNEARLFALKIVRDKVYREALLRAARERTLPAAVEVTLLAYAYGKPTERVELGRPGSFDALSDLSTSELVERARLLVRTAEGLCTPTDEALRAAEAQTDQALEYAADKRERRNSRTVESESEEPSA